MFVVKLIFEAIMSVNLENISPIIPDDNKQKKLSEDFSNKNRFVVFTVGEDSKLHGVVKIINDTNTDYFQYHYNNLLYGYNIEVKNIKGEKIIVDINSLIPALGLDISQVEKIKTEMEKGNLEEFVQEMSKGNRMEALSKEIHNLLKDVDEGVIPAALSEAKPTAQVEETEIKEAVVVKSTEEMSVEEMYAHVMQLFDVVDDELVYKDTGQKTGLKAYDLKNGIEEAYGSLGKSRAVGKKRFKFWHTPAGKRGYLVKKLGEGTYGKAYLFIDLNEPLAGVFKDARRKGNPSVVENARRDVQNEYDLLTEIHQGGMAWGIQARPRICKAINVQTQNDPARPLKERYGYIGQRYDGDYLEDILLFGFRQPLEIRLIEFHQLLAGLKRLAEANILHGDIKLENIFCKLVGQFPFVHIADIGGACRTNKTGSLFSLIAGGEERTASPKYICYEDREKSYRLARAGDRQALINNEKKRDVFSMGVTLHAALSGFFPFDFAPDGMPEVLVSPKYPLKSEEVPKELIKIIEKMIKLHTFERYTAAEAFEAYDRFVKNKYPELYARIQQEISKGFVV